MGRKVMRVKEGARFHIFGEGSKVIRATRGTWYQMWQTVSDQPYTPAFETPEELAKWCTRHPWGAHRDNSPSYEQWLNMIKGPGSAPSFVASDGVVKNGVSATEKGQP